MARKEREVHLASRADLETKDQLDNLENKDQLDLKDCRGYLGHRDHLDLVENKEFVERLDPWVQLV